MPLPCLYIYRCLINTKENLPFLSVRKDFHRYPTRKYYLLAPFVLDYKQLKVATYTVAYMEIKLFNNITERAWTVNIKTFRITLDN